MVDSVGNVHPAFRAFWHPVAWSSEVTAAVLPVTLLGEPLIVLRRPDGVVVAFHDACPHRGAPMSLGDREGDELVCPFHGWRFGFDGAATCIPSIDPASPIPSRARLGDVARVQERYGIVWVALDEPLAPIIDWPDGDDPALGQFSPTSHVSEVLAGYQTDNILDASHFSFLHGVLAARSPRFERYEVLTDEEYGFATRVPFSNAGREDEVYGWYGYVYRAPYSATLRNEEPDGRLRRSFFQAIQPIDERRTRLFFIVRGHETDPGALAAERAVEEVVQQEDLRMTVAQRRTALSIDDGFDLHVRSDRNGILYRRVLRRIIDTYETTNRPVPGREDVDRRGTPARAKPSTSAEGPALVSSDSAVRAAPE